MGWDMRRLETFAHDLAGTNGNYMFARNETANPAATGTTGNSFASFLLGLARFGDTPPPRPCRTPIFATNITAFYFQDNWRVTPKLTLNLGLRYDVPINWYAPTMGSVSLTAPNPAANNYPGRLCLRRQRSQPARCERASGPPISPTSARALGFAYQINPKTVLRGGFGIFYEATSNGGCGCTLGANGSFAQVSDGLNAPFQWDGGIPKPAGYQPPPFLGPSVGNGLAVDYMGPTFGKAPRIYNWSLNLQREVEEVPDRSGLRRAIAATA